MFPSFKNVSDRNRKRQELIERIENDLEIKALQRRAYSSAIWADEREKNKIDFSSLFQKLVPTNPSTKDVQNLYEAMGDNNNNNPPTSGSTFAVGDPYDAMADIGNEDDSMSDIDENEFHDALEQLAIKPRLAMLDDEEKPDLVEQEVEGFFQAGIEAIYDNNSSLAQKRISPVDKEGELMKNYYIGPYGQILSKANAELLDNPINVIDWRLTYLYVKGKVNHDKYKVIKAQDVGKKAAAFKALKKFANAKRLTKKTKTAIENVTTDDRKVRLRGLVKESNERALNERVETRGRGLRGGAITCKNLAKIEGSGTASDLKYKRIGSKFIRIADLKKNRLKLVFPNRTSVGPIRDISPELAAAINTLVFERDINQQLYNRLCISDKQFFQDILRLTHLQHQFSCDLKNPLEELQNEFDKLRSQVLLGNDNPQLIKELKALTIDLYGHKLISEEEFRQVMLTV